MSLQDAFFNTGTSTPAAPTPTDPTSSLGSSFFNVPTGQTTPTGQPSIQPTSDLTSKFFGAQEDNTTFDNSELKSVSLDHPWEAIKTIFGGAANDIGGVASGLGKLAYTPIQVGVNLLQGKSDVFNNTVIDTITNIAGGIAGADNPEYDAVKNYYGQYFTHPIEMIANHPVNTLLDIASILDLGSTSFGSLSKFGEVNTLLKASTEARLAGDAERAATLAEQARTLQAASTSGKIASGLETIQQGINPLRLGGKVTFGILNKTAPSVVDFAKSIFDRGTQLGIDENRANPFLNVANSFEAIKNMKNEAFLSDLKPKISALIDNPELVQAVTDGLDRPQLVADQPFLKTIVDGIKDVFNEHVTDPELAGKLLKALNEEGYFAHYYETEEPGFFSRRNFKANNPNAKSATILRFDPVTGGNEALVGSTDFHNLAEVNKDAEISKIESKGQKQMQKLLVNQKDKVLVDQVSKIQKLRTELQTLEESRIKNPDLFQTEQGNFGNTLEIETQLKHQQLDDLIKELKDELTNKKTIAPDYENALQIQNEISRDSSQYNVAQRLFKNDKGELYTGRRPIRTELLDSGFKPLDLYESLDKRAKSSFVNQAKLQVGDELGKRFGSLEKPTEPLDQYGHKWVKSSTLRTPDGQFYYVPEDVEQAASHYFDSSPQSQLMHLLTGTSKVFKRLLYALPGSSLVHSIHLAFNSVLGGLTPLDIIDAVRGVRNADEIFTKYKNLGGGSEISQGFFEKSAKDVTDLTKPSSTLKTIAKKLNPFGEDYIQNAVLSKEGDVLHHALYRRGLRQGLTEDEALTKANKFIGDYKNLTPEEKMLQALFPFYSWMKTSIPLNAMALTDQAGKLNFARWVGTPFDLQLDKNVAAGKFEISDDGQGNATYLKAPVPLNDVASIIRDLPAFAYQRLNPAITVPASIASNKQNPFVTDPNLQALNQITDPYAPDLKDQAIFGAGKIANPLALVSNYKDLHTLLLNSGGLYESKVSDQTQTYFDRVDAKNALTDLQKQYKKALKNNDTYKATFYNRAIMMVQAQLQAQ